MAGGGVLVLYVSSVARIWGAEHVGQVYGFLFSANIPAAAAPFLAALVYDGNNSFVLPLTLCAVLLLAAAAAVYAIDGALCGKGAAGLTACRNRSTIKSDEN